MESVSAYLSIQPMTSLNGKLKRRTPFRKCVCEIQRNKVLELENTTLSAERERLFLPGLLYSCVQKGQKQTQNRSLETT